MTTGPVDVVVDTTTLRDVGRELQSLIAALDGASYQAATDPAAMGGTDVADAVDRFLRRWADGRGDTVAKLRDCLTHVENAIDAYEATEGCLQRASLPGPTAGAGTGRTA
jgi:uncharacterized protein YyaL (SSP411 family)